MWNASSKRLASADDVHQDDHDGDHEKDVDQAPERVRAHETQDPEDEEDDGDGVEHGMGLSAGRFVTSCRLARRAARVGALAHMDSRRAQAHTRSMTLRA